jgi:hypothetical protein
MQELDVLLLIKGVREGIAINAFCVTAKLRLRAKNNNWMRWGFDSRLYTC